MIDSEKPYLVVDASSPDLHSGVIKKEQWLSLKTFQGDTLESLTKLVDECLKESSLNMESIKGFIFCEGPGSLLGLRLSAMAINTWKVLADQTTATPLLCYKSLPALGIQLQKGKSGFDHVVSPFRKGFYNHYDIKQETLSLIEAETAQSLNGKIAFLPQRRLKEKLNESWQQVTYSLKDLPAIIAKKGLLHQADYADAWVPEETEYVRWSQERHR
jgi:tRNA threonylcarbamoyladenosine biosynthesis protein TsaB